MEIANLHGRKKLGLLFRGHCLVPLPCEDADLLLNIAIRRRTQSAFIPCRRSRVLTGSVFRFGRGQERAHLAGSVL